MTMRKYLNWLIGSFVAVIVMFICADANEGNQGYSVFGILAVFALMFFGILFYFMPYAIARNRKVENYTVVFLVNLLIGWCFIGWLVALAMSCFMQTEVQAEIEREIYASIRNK
jgi:hypothetical protein